LEAVMAKLRAFLWGAEILLGLGAMVLAEISATLGILWLEILAGVLFLTAFVIFIVRCCRA